MTEPPSAGAVQVIKMLLPLTMVVSTYGVEGTVGIIAPFPVGDATELPIELVAIIRA